MNAEFTEIMRPLGDDVAEISLLLPVWQAEELQQAAYSQGMTTAQLMRRLLADAFAEGKHTHVIRCAS